MSTLISFSNFQNERTLRKRTNLKYTWKLKSPKRERTTVRGCKSTFSYWKSNTRVKKAGETDALVLGSPIYYGSVTGEMRSFMERLLFPYSVYDANRSTLFNRRIKTGLIYTMNVREEQMKQIGYDRSLGLAEMVMARIFGKSESLFIYDTYQFDDYSKYETTVFDVEAKAKRRKEEFPKDCQKAFEMGVRVAQTIE
jgi:multimeric flavodoxin WrbA